MLTDRLVAKIGDLGVAKVISADSRQTKSIIIIIIIIVVIIIINGQKLLGSTRLSS